MVAGAIYFAAVRLILRHVWPRGTVWIVLGVAVSLRVLTLAAPPILARTNETPLWYAQAESATSCGQSITKTASCGLPT
jgi:hypothetical protein